MVSGSWPAQALPAHFTPAGAADGLPALGETDAGAGVATLPSSPEPSSSTAAAMTKRAPTAPTTNSSRVRRGPPGRLLRGPRTGMALARTSAEPLPPAGVAGRPASSPRTAVTAAATAAGGSARSAVAGGGPYSPSAAFASATRTASIVTSCRSSERLQARSASSHSVTRCPHIGADRLRQRLHRAARRQQTAVQIPLPRRLAVSGAVRDGGDAQPAALDESAQLFGELAHLRVEFFR
ncbi:hypothetical protein GCM10020000_31980 [Streptomyces olivoverticillatus]